ncbi:MAG: hypothetical protein QOE70_674 [Chthoniobacter sp.]|nr:hypothetical protein [Chthoniobacter sp.]
MTGHGEKPAIPLYLPDHKHPTPAGSYLAACVFYRVLYGVPSATVPGEIASQKISKQEAEALQKIADAVPLPATGTP